MGHEAKNVLFCLKNVGLAKDNTALATLKLKQGKNQLLVKVGESQENSS